jgi:hypothetical protein
LHKIWCTVVVGSSTKSHQARYTTPNKKDIKIRMSIQLRDISYTDSQDILVLSCAAASRYSCSTDGSTNSGNYKHPFVRKTCYYGSKDFCVNVNFVQCHYSPKSWNFKPISGQCGQLMWRSSYSFHTDTATSYCRDLWEWLCNASSFWYDNQLCCQWQLQNLLW